MNKKILITGTTGMVGHYIDRADWDCEVIKTTRRDFDVTRLEEVGKYFESKKYNTESRKSATFYKGDFHVGRSLKAIVHMAAETDVDLCERNPDHAYRTNTMGTQNMVYMAQKYDILLLYVSTVGVFGGDGSPGPFDEFSEPCPANIYGKSKLWGERIVRSHLSKHFIVRPGWMMGGDLKKDKKFVVKIVKQLMEGKKEISALINTFGSPTYAKDLIRNIAELLRTEYYGTYHCTNHGSVSRYWMANKIVKGLGSLFSDVKVEPVGNDYFDLDAGRAVSECSENRMLYERGLDMMRPAEDAMVEYLQEIKEEIGRDVHGGKRS